MSAHIQALIRIFVAYYNFRTPWGAPRSRTRSRIIRSLVRFGNHFIDPRPESPSIPTGFALRLTCERTCSRDELTAGRNTRPGKVSVSQTHELTGTRQLYGPDSGTTHLRDTFLEQVHRYFVLIILSAMTRRVALFRGNRPLFASS